MTKERGLLAAYLLDGQGGAKSIGWNEVNSWGPKAGILWVHLNYESEMASKWLLQNSYVDHISARSLLAKGSRPRALVSQDSLLVCLRGVNLNAGKDPEDMISIRVWLNSNCIITTCRHQMRSIHNIEQGLLAGHGPAAPGSFLVALNDGLLDNMSAAIEALDDEVDALEEAVLTAESSLLRPRVADARRECTLIRRYLVPQKNALNSLYLEETTLLTGADKARTRESSDRVLRYIEDLDSARERASITQEELVNQLSEQMEGRMYMLSIVTAIFLPLSFLTGLLGINVAGIPGANYKWAFLIVCVVMSFILGIVLWWARKKKWI